MSQSNSNNRNNLSRNELEELMRNAHDFVEERYVGNNTVVHVFRNGFELREVRKPSVPVPNHNLPPRPKCPLEVRDLETNEVIDLEKAAGKK